MWTVSMSGSTDGVTSGEHPIPLFDGRFPSDSGVRKENPFLVVLTTRHVGHLLFTDN